MTPPLGIRIPRRRRRLAAGGCRPWRLAAASGLLLLGAAAHAQTQPRFDDAIPSPLPPGFQPADISREVDEIQARRIREMEAQVDTEAHYRNSSPETRMRARWGGATWNMYDPHYR